MLRNAKAAALTLAVLFAAGCAQSDYVVSRNGQTQWERVDKAAIANAPEAVPPKILPETYFAAGRLFEAQGLLGKAITQYRKAVAVNHEYGDAFHRLGVVLGTIGQHAEATEALGRAAELRPNDAVLRNNLGFEFILQGRWEDAERELNRAIELQPHFARAHINLGMTLSRGQRFDEALASFRKVLPEPDAYYNLALMLRGRKRYEEAVDALRHTLAIAPHFTAATSQLEQLAERLRPVTPSEPKADGATPLDDASKTTGLLAGVNDAEATPGEQTTPLGEESPAPVESLVVAKGDDRDGPLGASDGISGAVDDADYEPCEDGFFDDSSFTLFDDFFDPEDANRAFEDAAYALPITLTDGIVGPTAAEVPAIGRTGETPDYEDVDLEDSVGILFRPNERWLMPTDAAVSSGVTGGEREVLSATVLSLNETGPPWRVEEPTAVSTRETGDLSAPPGVRVELQHLMHPLKTGATKTPEGPEVKGRAPGVATPPADRNMPVKGDAQEPVKKRRPSAKATVSSPTVVAQVEDSPATEARRADVEDSRLTRASETPMPDVGPVYGPRGPVTRVGRSDVDDPSEQMMFPTSEETGHPASVIVEAAMPETSVERLLALKPLRTDLAVIRQEMECWEEVLAEQAEAERRVDEVATADQVAEATVQSFTGIGETGLMTSPIFAEKGHPGEVPGIHAGVTLVPHATDTPRPVMSSIIASGDTREKGVVETPVPEAPINRFRAFKSLELKLALVRQEIDCWEEVLTEQAAASGSDAGAAEPEAPGAFDPLESRSHGARVAGRSESAPEVADSLIISTVSDETGHPTSQPPNDPAIVYGPDRVKSDVVGPHALVAAADPVLDLYLPTPPVEFDYDWLVMAGSPTLRLATSGAPELPLLATGTTGYGPEIDLFIDEVSVALNPPSDMPEITTVLTLGRAKDEVLKRRMSRPVLSSEVWEEPAYIAERTPSGDSAEGPTRPTLAAGVDVAQLVVEEVTLDKWDETFGDVEELFSIVRNQMDCWHALDASDAAQVEQFESSLRYTDSKN